MSQTLEQLTAERDRLNQLIKVAEQDVARSAVGQINALIEQAHAKIKEAETLALKHKVEFDFSLEYGMGGTFNARDWQNSDDSTARTGYWQSSSSTC